MPDHEDVKMEVKTFRELGARRWMETKRHCRKYVRIGTQI